jgi:hypothetical protein
MSFSIGKRKKTTKTASFYPQIANMIPQKICQYEYHKDGHLACLSLLQAEPSG